MRETEKTNMSVLQIAFVAFAAGFLSCMALAIAIVWWSFADERVRGIKSVTSKSREQRTA